MIDAFYGKLKKYKRKRIKLDLIDKTYTQKKRE